MPPRLFERLAAAFWGYVSPQQPQPVARRQPSAAPKSRPSRAAPARFLTPPQQANSYMPTPIDTPIGSKRKRRPEVEDIRKRNRIQHVQDQDEDMSYEDRASEFLTMQDDGYGDDEFFSEHDEYDSGDEDDDEGIHYDYNIYNPTVNLPKPAGRVFDEQDEGEDDIEYDDSIYNPTLRSNKPLPGQRTLLESALPKDIPNIIVSSEDDVIDVLPRQDTAVYGDGDEDLIVFADSDEAGNDVLTDGQEDNSSAVVSHKDASLFESFFEEAIDGDTILVDSRARVGSLEDERVTKQQLLDRNWPENNIWLVQRIHNRGREPIFAYHWRMDFPMMPEGMFLPPKHAHPGYINALRNRDFRAKHAFARLMQLGPRVRDKILVGLTPEKLIVDELRAYMRWSDQDSNNQYPNHPLLKIYAGTKDEDVNAMQDELLSRLHALHQTWSAHDPSAPIPRSSDDSAPPLYGILVSHTLVGIVAFVPGGDGSDSIGYLRTVGVFDFSMRDYDVWTSLALALLVVHIRDVGVKRGCSRRPFGQRGRWGKDAAAAAAALTDDPDA